MENRKHFGRERIFLNALTSLGMADTEKYHFLDKEIKNQVRKEASKRYEKNNKERISQRGKKYRENNKKQLKERRKNNKEQLAQQRKNWRERGNNKERVKQRQRKWLKDNSEKKQIYNQRRISRKRSLLSDFTAQQWQTCKAFFDYRCAYCGRRRKLQQDHFIPVNNNGGYTKNNIIPVCIECNDSKGTRDFFDWYSKQTFYKKNREKQILSYLFKNNQNILFKGDNDNYKSSSF